MMLCYDCLDERSEPERQQHRRTTYGERCDACKRIETEALARADSN